MVLGDCLVVFAALPVGQAETNMLVVVALVEVIRDDQAAAHRQPGDCQDSSKPRTRRFFDVVIQPKPKDSKRGSDRYEHPIQRKKPRQEVAVGEGQKEEIACY